MGSHELEVDLDPAGNKWPSGPVEARPGPARRRDHLCVPPANKCPSVRPAEVDGEARRLLNHRRRSDGSIWPVRNFSAAPTCCSRPPRPSQVTSPARLS